ncbi:MULTISPECIES: prolyl oligopeptidase family serine peptidase [unclassified Streptomyces]|uniref:Prolyl oligopeptidase family serine peptidase n=1 Tax=Streptomyces thermocoprophilus TaxID=78356 RepID=A0ABV5V6Y8_9ACTN|nr:prolyl oligopeptidase family serine peptidase [Streptomyces sp. XM83C]
MSDAARYQVFRSALPESCPGSPDRMVFTADAEGRCEVFTWDAATRRVRQVTSRPGGTFHCAIDHDADVWWFEEDEDGLGTWMYAPFATSPAGASAAPAETSARTAAPAARTGDSPAPKGGTTGRPGLLGLPPGLPRGLAFAADGTTAVALTDGRVSTVHVGRKGGSARLLLSAEGPLALRGMASDGGLLAVSGGADDAVVLLTADGTVTAVLPPGPARQWCRGFRPAGGRELLLVRESGDRYVLATWTPEDGTVVHDWCVFDTEISARWYPDAREVLVRQDRHGRSLLHRVDLTARRRSVLPTRPGTVLDAAPRPGGGLHCLWTDTTHPPVLLATDGTPLPPLTGTPPRVPGRHRDLWTSTPDGPVHTLLSLPDTAAPGRPAPLVFLVHGGPADQDRDAYDGTVHSLVASGYAVARVNYRGSTGYGPRWRHAFTAGVGHTQVQDLAAVRADLLRRGLAAPDATALWGVSWGAYLVLLALGTRPELWRAGIAVKPLADWAAAHRSSTSALRAFDIRLFGGTPDEVPERYARSSPLSYASRVTAPLLVVGATRDVKCPPDQIRSYLAALDDAGVPYEAMWLDTGHDGYDGAAHVAVLRRAMTFLNRRLAVPRGPVTEDSPGRRGSPEPPRTRRPGPARTAH